MITTTNVNDLVLIEWDQPVTNGSPVTSYRVYIQETGQGDFFEVQQTCDGSSAEVLTSRSCTVSLSELRGIVFNLVQGESVWVKVITANLYGESAISEPGNNAVIQLVPDAPINLQIDLVETDDTKIRFLWTEGPNDGGVPVLDYDIYYDQGAATATYVIMEENVLDQFYVTTVALTPGEEYTFKLTARNSVGDSQKSNPITIMAAKIPDAPVGLADVPTIFSLEGEYLSGITTAFKIGLTWSEGAYNGGTPVLDYQVLYSSVEDNLFTLYSKNITSPAATVEGLSPGVSYKFVV